MAHHVCFSFLLVIILLNEVFCEDEFKAGFSSEAETCPDFDNKDIDLNLYLTPMESDDEDGSAQMALEGTLGLGISVDSDYMLSIDIVKETDTGSEVMWKVSMPLCDALKDDDAPWKPIFESMGIEKCPIEAKEYKVANMRIELDFAEQFLNHNYVGRYTAVVKIEDQQMNEKSCHALSFNIIEI